jgi:hypothetical protein
MNTPVAFFVFNRPSTTKRVFEAIRRARPPKLLVVADGPRPDHPEDADRCLAVRAIIQQVDWDCEILLNYSDVNLGCGVRVSTGLDWAFNQVEEAIILEDDCLPHPHFFDFCEILLDQYRYNDKIMHIGGNHHLIGYKNQSLTYDYYFSRYPLIWGWATWRRAWKHYDFKAEYLKAFIDDGWLEKLLGNKRQTFVWKRNFESLYENFYTWDYQWILTCWINEGLAIHPTKNLVSNIGFDTASTHTKDSKNLWSALPTKNLTFPIKHPPFTIRDSQADHHLQNTKFDPSKLNRFKMRLRYLKKLVNF